MTLHPLCASRSRRSGFSLLEILIVAALLAIFASIAVINIATVYRENQRKTVVGELRQFREAVGFSLQDVNLVPKLNFLTQSRIGIIDPASPIGQERVTEDFAMYGHTIPDRRRRQYVDNWNGGYISVGRPLEQTEPSALGRAGYVRMQIGSGVVNPINPNSGNNVVAWPADLWGNPYVVYMLQVDLNGNVTFVQTPYEDTNYALDFVSYGPDGVPGSYTLPNVEPPAEVTRKEGQRLYNIAPVGGGYEFIARPETDFRVGTASHNAMLQGYSERVFGNPNYIGSFDPGSDDLHSRLK